MICIFICRYRYGNRIVNVVFCWRLNSILLFFSRQIYARKSTIRRKNQRAHINLAFLSKKHGKAMQHKCYTFLGIVPIISALCRTSLFSKHVAAKRIFPFLRVRCTTFYTFFCSCRNPNYVSNLIFMPCDYCQVPFLVF